MNIRVMFRKVRFKLFDCIRDNDRLTSSCLNSNCCNNIENSNSRRSCSCCKRCKKQKHKNKHKK